jgi:hypothetical protein
MRGEEGLGRRREWGLRGLGTRHWGLGNARGRTSPPGPNPALPLVPPVLVLIPPSLIPPASPFPPGAEGCGEGSAPGVSLVPNV